MPVQWSDFAVKCFCIFVGTGVFVGTVALTLWLFDVARNQFMETRQISAMAFLHIAIREGLNGYYRDHGEYPTNLTQIADLKFGDGATPEMLTNFHYFSKGSHFVLVWVTPSGREIRLRGRDGIVLEDDWVAGGCSGAESQQSEGRQRPEPSGSHREPPRSGHGD